MQNGRAYTLSEIGSYIYERKLTQKDILIIQQALKELIEEGVIEAKEVETRFGKETYYCVKKINTIPSSRKIPQY